MEDWERKIFEGASGIGEEDGEGFEKARSPEEKRAEFSEAEGYGKGRTKGNARENFGDKYRTQNGKLAHKHETIAHMLASGMSNIKISQDLGMDQGSISILANTTDMTRRVKEIQREYWGGNIEKRFKNSLPKAMDVLEESLTSDEVKMETKSSNARWLLEKVTGKAKQEVDIKASVVSNLLGTLDEMREAETEDEVLELRELTGKTEQDELDLWVHDNVPEHSGVGKKGEGDV